MKRKEYIFEPCSGWDRINKTCKHGHPKNFPSVSYVCRGIEISDKQLVLSERKFTPACVKE